MAKQVKLAAERRETIGRSAMRKLKGRGIIPAIVYGGKDKPQPLQVSRRDINVMLSHASGENILVELEIAGEKSSRMAMIQEIQHSPVGGAAAGPEVIKEKKEEGEAAAPTATGAPKAAAPAAKEKEAKK